MKLSEIKKEHILQAGEYIDHYGVPEVHLSNNYWVELPNGKEYPFKYLIKMAYQMIEGKAGDWLDFQTSQTYINYVKNDLGFPVHYHKEGVNFFSEEDFEYLLEYGGSKYDKTNDEHKRIGEFFKPIAYKIEKWAEKARIEDFYPRGSKGWQHSGTFKGHIMRKLIRDGSDGKVFFWFGITKDGGGGLYYKIDWPYKKGTLGYSPIGVQKQFEEYIRNTDYKEVFISRESLRGYTWEKLIAETTRFLNKYSALYDELENLVASSPTNMPVAKPGLTPVEPPRKTRTKLNRQRTFQGQVIDWAQKQTSTKQIGDAGEALVIAAEREKLTKSGWLDKADLVAKVKDGMGYDILSFDEAGNELHIEVKTTTGKVDEPFYFSINEKEFMEQHPDNYYLYRLHEFRFDPASANFYKLSAAELLERAAFNAINFEVSIGL